VAVVAATQVAAKHHPLPHKTPNHETAKKPLVGLIASTVPAFVQP
jgi:hypothetical protein